MLGKEVEYFEKEFAEYIGSKYCIVLASGLDALWIAFRILGIGRISFLESYVNMLNMQGRDLSELSVAEAGVFRGDFAGIINILFPTNRLYLFDTFEGFELKDIKYEIEKEYSKSNIFHLGNTSEELVINKMKYPENIVIKKGYFPDTAQHIDETFIYVNLDFDLYKPTKEGLLFFGDKMVTGGIITVHDYFDDFYNGVNQAVSDFFLIHPEAANSCFPIGDKLSIGIQKRI